MFFSDLAIRIGKFWYPYSIKAFLVTIVCSTAYLIGVGVGTHAVFLDTRSNLVFSLCFVLLSGFVIPIFFRISRPAFEFPHQSGIIWGRRVLYYFLPIIILVYCLMSVLGA